MTPWRDKYGSAQFDWDSEKSGFTPLDLTFPGEPLDPASEEFRRREIIEAFQGDKLRGYTSMELVQLDAITVRDMKPATLNLPIIPLLQRTRWEKTPSKQHARTQMYPLPAPHLGVWTAHDDRVWEILKPSLQLSSYILVSTELLPWFDALLNGERREIKDHRKPIINRTWDLRSFHCRGAQTIYKNAAKDRDNTFKDLIENWEAQFCFMQLHHDPHYDNVPMEHVHGLTYRNDEHVRAHPGAKRRAFVGLSIGDVAPLLSGTLNGSEKMALEWHVANTLVHETMHLIYTRWAWMHPQYMEPYFENEQVQELGFSFENSLYGGTIEPLLFPGLPLGFSHATPWPTKKDAGCGNWNDPVLSRPDLPDEYRSYAVPMTMFEDMFQQDFWNLLVRQFTHKLLRHRYIKNGILVNSNFHWSPHRRPPFSLEENALETKARALLARDLANLKPDELRQMKFANELFSSAHLDEAFWTATNEQIQKMDEFTNMTTWQNLGSLLRLALLSRVKDAISAHLKAVQVLNEIERYEGNSSRQRRETLLAWNRGTRVFLNMFPETDFYLRDTRRSLEESRLSLWSPNDPHNATQPVSEKVEWDRIQAAQGFFGANQFNECVQACNIIHNDEACSLYGKTAAKMLTLGIKWSLPEHTTAVKMRELQDMGNLMNEIKGWGMKRSIETAWGGVCDQWLRMVFYFTANPPLITPPDPYAPAHPIFSQTSFTTFRYPSAHISGSTPISARQPPQNGASPPMFSQPVGAHSTFSGSSFTTYKLHSFHL